MMLIKWKLFTKCMCHSCLKAHGDAEWEEFGYYLIVTDTEKNYFEGCGRSMKTIHSISNSIVYRPWRGSINITTL